MATTVRHPKEAIKANGAVDLAKAAEGAKHAMEQYLSGKEIMLDMDQIALNDGTHLTMFHHKAAQPK